MTGFVIYGMLIVFIFGMAIGYTISEWQRDNEEHRESLKEYPEPDSELAND
jgi:hypothetical protein